MKRLVLSVSIVGVLVWTALGVAGPLPPEADKTAQIPPLASNTYRLMFKGGEWTHATVVGTSGSTFLGLYIYDAYGNCIALDDWGTPETGAAVAVDWLPREQGLYMVEIRNSSFMKNEINIAIR